MFLKSTTLTLALCLLTSLAFGQTRKTPKKATAKPAAKQDATVPDAAPVSTPEPVSEPPSQESAPAQAEAPKHEAGKAPPFTTVFFLRAFEDQNALTTKFNYQTASPSIDSTASGTTTNIYDVKGTVTNFNAQYERGISQNFALGIRLEYKSLTKQYTAKTSSPALPGKTDAYTGLNDIFLVALGAVPMESWAFNYGLDIGISPGKRTIENAANGDVTGNGYSGGMSAKPYVGLTYDAATDGKVVGKVEYNYLFDRSVDSKNVTTGVTTAQTLTGAGVLLIAAGYEWQWTPCFLDAYLIYRSVADQKTSANGAPAYVASGDAAVSQYGLGAAFSSFVSHNAMLGIQYEGLSVADSTTPASTTGTGGSEIKTKSTLAHSVTVGARFHF